MSLGRRSAGWPTSGSVSRLAPAEVDCLTALGLPERVPSYLHRLSLSYIPHRRGTKRVEAVPHRRELFTSDVIDRHSPPRTSKQHQKRLRRIDSMNA